MKVLALVLLVAACASESPPPAPPIAQSSAATPWVDVRGASGHPLLEAPATALGDPDQRASISVAARARVLRILVAPGDQVVANTPLIEVAYPELAAAAANLAGAVDQLEAQDRRRAQLEGLRAEGLARVGEVSAVEVEQARLRSERDLAAATLRAAGLDAARAHELVATGGRATLRAPIAGVVVSLDAAIGQLREPGGGAVAEIVAGGVHRVEARLTQMLPDGAPVAFLPATGGERAATLVRTEPQRAPDGTTRAWFEIDGSGLVAGQPGRIRIGVSGDVVAVAATAIARDKDGEHVWRRAGDRRERVPVTVIARSGSDALVRGLRPGDQVAARAAEDAP